MRAAPVGTGVHKHPHTLRGAQLKIARGQTAGLLGRNGMGKSTLIRTLLGHVAQRDGHITLFGKDASRFKQYEVAHLGLAYVPEGRGVFPKERHRHPDRGPRLPPGVGACRPGSGAAKGIGGVAGCGG